MFIVGSRWAFSRNVIGLRSARRVPPALSSILPAPSRSRCSPIPAVAETIRTTAVVEGKMEILWFREELETISRAAVTK